MTKKKKKFLDIVFSVLIVIVSFLFAYKIMVKLDYHFQWWQLHQYFFYFDDGLKLGLLLKGFIFTIKMSIFIILLSTFFALFISFIKYVNVPIFSNIVEIYVQAFRAVPPIVIMFISYFFIGDIIFNAFNLYNYVDGLSLIKKNILSFLFAENKIFLQYLSAIIGLSLYEASYISEILRGGFNGVEISHIDAGKSLGLNFYYRFRYIIMPQAFEKTLPALTGQYVSVVKNSAIASVIAIPELTFQGGEILASTRLTFEIWFTVLMCYFLINFSISRYTRRLEKKIRLKYGVS